jgi:hypothetical protein
MEPLVIDFVALAIVHHPFDVCFLFLVKMQPSLTDYTLAKALAQCQIKFIPQNSGLPLCRGVSFAVSTRFQNFVFAHSFCSSFCLVWLMYTANNGRITGYQNSTGLLVPQCLPCKNGSYKGLILSCFCGCAR